jgi:hypothetical protein
VETLRNLLRLAVVPVVDYEFLLHTRKTIYAIWEVLEL